MAKVIFCLLILAKTFVKQATIPLNSSTGNVVLGSEMIVLGVAITTGNNVLGSFIMISL